MQNQQKTIKGEQIDTCNVNWNMLLFDCVTWKYVSNRFILHLNWFMMLWKPKMTVHVKLAKLASIYPMWDKLAPSKPKWPQIDVWTWLKWIRAIMTPYHVWVCKIGEWEALGGIKCTKSVQNWTKSTPNAPSQPQCPHSMNVNAPTMMRVTNS